MSPSFPTSSSTSPTTARSPRCSTCRCDDPREVTHRIDYFGRSWYVPSYRFGEFKIWGLTAIMVVELVNLLYDDPIDLHTPPASFIKLS